VVFFVPVRLASIAARRAIIHQRPFARQHLACRAEVHVAFTVIGEVLAFEGSVATCRLVEHRDVRLDPALMNEPAEHLGRSIRTTEPSVIVPGVPHRRRSGKSTQYALLTSISHDFRTPLASILGAATSLIDYGGRLPEPARLDLLMQVKNEAEHLDGMAKSAGQHRPNRTLRSREQGSVARNQNALLDTANRDQLDIGNRLVGDKRVVSGCPQPASEPRKHPITENLHRASLRAR
jgi:signal transduction histidine kinase